jgi:uncharacterized protein (TIGR02147 family)
MANDTVVLLYYIYYAIMKNKRGTAICLVYIICMPSSTLPVIFDYLDYVKYLRDYYESRHKIDRWFSYRYIQSRTGIDPGYLFKVFQGKKTLPQKKIALLTKVLGLTKREKDYFNLLVLYGNAKSNDAIRQYFEKMLLYSEMTTRKVGLKEYEYYNKWYHAALRQILSYCPFNGDYKALARMTVPAITPEEARKGVETLCNLGFVQEQPDGSFRVLDRFLSTGDKWHSIAVRRFQQDTIMLAHKALDTVDKELRDISTVTVTLSAEGFVEARERIRQFRRDMLELVNRQDQPTGAYHVNIQMIPISRQWEGQKP